MVDLDLVGKIMQTGLQSKSLGWKKDKMLLLVTIIMKIKEEEDKVQISMSALEFVVVGDTNAVITCK